MLISLTIVKKYTKLPGTRTSQRSLFLTNAGQKFKGFISQLFLYWGQLTADHWYLVIPVVLFVVFACCAGLPFLEVTTDPWSLPSSRAQKEKEYFDQHFAGASYCASQIIITAPDSPGFNFSNF